jgi:hypothetical protein
MNTGVTDTASEIRPFSTFTGVIFPTASVATAPGHEVVSLGRCPTALAERKHGTATAAGLYVCGSNSKLCLGTAAIIRDFNPSVPSGDAEPFTAG